MDVSSHFYELFGFNPHCQKQFPIHLDINSPSLPWPCRFSTKFSNCFVSKSVPLSSPSYQFLLCISVWVPGSSNCVLFCVCYDNKSRRWKQRRSITSYRTRPAQTFKRTRQQSGVGWPHVVAFSNPPARPWPSRLKVSSVMRPRYTWWSPRVEPIDKWFSKSRDMRYRKSILYPRRCYNGNRHYASP
jgi:hypothetical protein